jgi:hypothetical protein
MCDPPPMPSGSILITGASRMLLAFVLIPLPAQGSLSSALVSLSRWFGVACRREVETETL